MAQAPLTAAEKARTIKAIKKHGSDRYAIMKELGIGYTTLGSRISNLGGMQGILGPDHNGQKNYRKSIAGISVDKKTLDEFDVQSELARVRNENTTLKKALDRARGAKLPNLTPRRANTGAEDLVRVVIPDSHGCFIDETAAATFLRDLKNLAPHEIVMLGDHVDAGGFLAQHHVWGYVADGSYTYEQDIQAANHFLDRIQEAAPSAKIHYIEGNHEQRVERWCMTQALRQSKDAEFLRSVFAPNVLLKLKERGVNYYRRSTMYFNLPIPGTIKLGKCYFSHEGHGGKNSSAHMVRRYGAPIVFGHVHRQQADMIRTVSSGVVGAWSPGCLAKLQPLWLHTNLSDWAHGYGVQFVNKSGLFIHLNIPILKDGVSLLPKFR